MLTDDQINDIAEKCGCGYFEYGDAQGKVRLGFARAIEVAVRRARGHLCATCGTPLNNECDYCQKLWKHIMKKPGK